MNEIKVNMIKFLMTMFESSADCLENIKAPQVRLFKNNVDELVRRNQIPNSVRNLVYSIYGIMNTDTFKPDMQANKLMQINMLMMQLSNILTVGNVASLTSFKNTVENGVKQGTILKSARDIVFEIYDLDTYRPVSNPQPKQKPVVGAINTTRPPNLGAVIDVADTKKKSKEVQQDIAQFKSQYVPEIYYEYPNPNFYGCSGSSRDLHTKLIDAKTRPDNATFVIRKLLRDDGCHQSFGFVSVPKEYYNPASVPTTRINTPTTGSAVGCTGGGYSSRHC